MTEMAKGKSGRSPLEPWLENLRARLLGVTRRRVPHETAEDLVQDALKVIVERGLRVGSFDTLVVSGGDGVNAAFADAKTLGWVRRAAVGTAARITSVCSGSLLLAASGVLDGRSATTHWYRTREFRQRFPNVRLEADRIFVNDGRFWTSAGISAGIDLALALISHDLGDTLARRVAQQLVVYYRRPGGQSQFSALLEMEQANGRFTVSV